MKGIKRLNVEKINSQLTLDARSPLVCDAVLLPKVWASNGDAFKGKGTKVG